MVRHPRKRRFDSFFFEFLFFYYPPADGEKKKLSSPHVHVFSYTRVVCQFNSIAQHFVFII